MQSEPSGFTSMAQTLLAIPVALVVLTCYAIAIALAVPIWLAYNIAGYAGAEPEHSIHGGR